MRCTRGRLRRSASAIVAAIASCSALAGAESKDLCLGPHEGGQDLRSRGALRSARDSFRECTRDSCPGPVRVDCVKWLAEVEARIPTLLVLASDETGHDLTGVEVEVDGKGVAGYAEGRPFEIDPGTHAMRFRAGDRTLAQNVVVREGEKDRTLRVVLPTRPAAQVPPAPAAEPPPQAALRRPVPVLAYVVGGVGIAALASFVTFDTMGFVKHGDLRSSCAPSCKDAQVSPIRTDYLVGDTSLGVSIVALGVATWLVLTRPTVPVSGASGAAYAPWLTPGGGGLRVTFD